MDRILIDECLSQRLLAVAKARGLHADHVVWLGKSGIQDWSLVSFAIERNYALVTNNRRDFLKEYSKHALHDGLVIVVPMVERDEQVRLFELALDAAASLPDTINRLIEVFSGGDVSVRAWSARDFDPAYLHSPARSP